MIGLISLTDAVNADPLLVNPNHISFIAPSSQALLFGMGAHNCRSIDKATIICLGAAIFQVNESVREVVSALTRLRVKHEDAAIALRKKAEREDWKDDDEYDSGDTADL